jgi:hypothetical protein
VNAKTKSGYQIHLVDAQRIGWSICGVRAAWGSNKDVSCRNCLSLMSGRPIGYNDS